MALGLLGKKLGMTQTYDAQGRRVPVTVIEAGPCPVIRVRTPEKDGYTAVQLGFGVRKEKRASKPLAGYFKKAGVPLCRWVREIRLAGEEDLKIYPPGGSVKVDCFSAGDYLDVTGVTIGKGFQGGVRRWGWLGGSASHGSMTHRRPGSIGASSFPSRVFRGHHMPGHMGNVRRTTQNVEVVEVDVEKNLLVVKGQVPGPANGDLIIRRALKKASRAGRPAEANEPGKAKEAKAASKQKAGDKKKTEKPKKK